MAEQEKKEPDALASLINEWNWRTSAKFAWFGLALCCIWFAARIACYDWTIYKMFDSCEKAPTAEQLGPWAGAILVTWLCCHAIQRIALLSDAGNKYQTERR
jgi:hypothetical protein